MKLIVDCRLLKSSLNVHSVIHYLLCHKFKGVKLFLILAVQSGMNGKVYGLLKEHSLKQRLAKQVERLGAYELQPLLEGDTVRIQNQRGSHLNKWTKQGLSFKLVIMISTFSGWMVRAD